MERPKSPWTPSYSVTRQGSVATEVLAEETVAGADQLSPPVTDEPAVVDAESQSAQIGATDVQADDKVAESEPVSPEVIDDDLHAAVITWEDHVVVPTSEVVEVRASLQCLDVS